MPVVIAHGQPKSGSTFLYMAALRLTEMVNGEEFYTFTHRVLGKEYPVFQDELSPDVLLETVEKVGPDKLFIIKTHTDLTDEVADLISAGQVQAFTSFRDPRDSALSALNAGEKDRAKGDTRWFAAFTEINQLVPHLARQVERVMVWIDHPDVLSIPYYITASSEPTSVGLLCEHLGYGRLKNVLAAKMAAEREKLPEFNKALLDRFVTGLSAEDIEFANEAWAKSIADYNAALETVMVKLGHRLAYNYFTQVRDLKLAERLS